MFWHKISQTSIKKIELSKYKRVLYLRRHTKCLQTIFSSKGWCTRPLTNGDVPGRLSASFQRKIKLLISEKSLRQCCRFCMNQFGYLGKKLANCRNAEPNNTPGRSCICCCFFSKNGFNHFQLFSIFHKFDLQKIRLFLKVQFLVLCNMLIFDKFQVVPTTIVFLQSCRC